MWLLTLIPQSHKCFSCKCYKLCMVPSISVSKYWGWNLVTLLIIFGANVISYSLSNWSFSCSIKWAYSDGRELQYFNCNMNRKDLLGKKRHSNMYPCAWNSLTKNLRCTRIGLSTYICSFMFVKPGIFNQVLSSKNYMRNFQNPFLVVDVSWKT